MQNAKKRTTSSDFKKYNQSKFAATAKPRKAKKVLPYQKESVQKMRAHIVDFCRKFPRTGLTFNTKNPHYRVGWKYFEPEDLLQIATCFWLAAYHPDIHILHPKNESKEGNVGQAKKKLMGVKEGASDLLLQCSGLPDYWLELKVKPNRPTKKQLAFLELQRSLGNAADIAYDLFEVLEKVSEWKAQTSNK